MNVVWSPIAVEQAAEIAGRMYRDHRGAAWRWIQALLRRARALDNMAGRGLALPELHARARIGEFHHDPARVIYRVDRDRIVVLAIKSARDPLHNEQRDGHHHRQ